MLKNLFFAPNRMHASRYCVVVTCSVLASCASTPPAVMEQQQTAAPETYATEAHASEAEASSWYKTFDDPQLQKLVLEAQRTNSDLRAAEAAVERSLALARQASGALFPAVDVTAGGQQSGEVRNNSSEQTSYSAGLQLGWELDIWGRLAASRAAARASAAAAQEQYRFASQSLAAATMRAYFIAINANAQAAILERSVSNLRKIADVVDLRGNEGFASPQDVQVTRADLATAQSNLTAAQGAERDALRALEVLLDRYPAAALELRTSLPDLPAAPPAGLPATLLQQRPDLRAAEYAVNAAFNRKVEAQAARFPGISLTSSVGGASADISNLLDAGNLAWSAAANLLGPLFRGGAIQAQIAAASADQKAAMADYRSAVLQAFNEVESTLDAGQVLADRHDALQSALVAAEEAYRIAKLRYDNGDLALLDLLSVEQRLFQSQSDLASVKRAQLEQRVNLHLALGGDWK